MSARLLHMISPSSLSAFSASITNGTLGNRVTGANPIQSVRAQQSVPARASAGQKLSPQTAPSVPPGQTLPRGSLLDLSV
jgi:hypothetical protein